MRRLCVVFLATASLAGPCLTALQSAAAEQAVDIRTAAMKGTGYRVFDDEGWGSFAESLKSTQLA